MCDLSSSLEEPNYFLFIPISIPSPNTHTQTHTPLSSPSLFLPHHSGKQCEECSPGFYGDPRISGAPCRPCACNNNIDVTDPESCSRVTGECLKCLHNTEGPNCQLCRPGHFGSALNQTCRSKSARLPGGCGGREAARECCSNSPVLVAVRPVVSAPTGRWAGAVSSSAEIGAATIHSLVLLVCLFWLLPLTPAPVEFEHCFSECGPRCTVPEPSGDGDGVLTCRFLDCTSDTQNWISGGRTQESALWQTHQMTLMHEYKNHWCRGGHRFNSWVKKEED